MIQKASNVQSIENAISGQDPVDAAMDAAIAELERLEANGHTTADLLQAREQYREQQRRSRASENGDSGVKVEITESIADRIKAVIQPADPDLARFLLGECEEDVDSVLEDSRTLSQLLQHVASAEHESYGGQAIEPEFAGRIGFMLVRQIETARAMLEHRDRAEVMAALYAGRAEPSE